MSDNILYYGDNLDVLSRHVKNESVDLVYLDPPFESNPSPHSPSCKDGARVGAEWDGTQAAAQIKAVEDTLRWDRAAAEASAAMVEAGGPVSQVTHAFRTFLGTNDMVAYLSNMATRLVVLRRVLKTTGSIDPNEDSL